MNKITNPHTKQVHTLSSGVRNTSTCCGVGVKNKKVKALPLTTFQENYCTKQKPQKVVRGLVLLSGGLDSILAAKLLIRQKIKVTGLTFKSYFFSSDQAEKAAKELGIKLEIVDFSKENLKIVKSPKHGYGKSINPCIDCHVLMLKIAKKIMREKGFDFVATGEVLGERPMSQNRVALDVIEKESSLSGYLLRPLSAKLLKKTIPEKKGLVNRENLFDISGRSRKRQIELAKKWRIKEYPTPAGGCLLTDLEFGKKLKELLKRYPGCKDSDIILLKYGRHFWPFDFAQGRIKIKIIIGRNEKEDREIRRLAYPPKSPEEFRRARKGDILIEMKNYPGPLTLVRNYGKGKVSLEIVEKTKNLTQYYSVKAREKKDVEFKIVSF